MNRMRIFKNLLVLGFLSGAFVCALEACWADMSDGDVFRYLGSGIVLLVTGVILGGEL